MSTEAAFLATLQANPSDDATRLVYADWLEEQDEPTAAARVEFLRLTVALARQNARKGGRKARRNRLQELAADLDTDWLAVVSRLRVENCRGRREEMEARPLYPVRFDFLCERRWEDMRPTGDQAVRYCEDCEQRVHYCDTITEARQHAQEGHCIAVDLGVLRRDRDLEPRRMWLGMPSAETLRQEDERMQPDPVSAARERRKQERAPEEA